MKLPGGLWVALATPFRGDGSVDLAAFSALASRMRRAGVDALVVLGSTGEASALTPEERDLLVTATLAAAQGVPVVVGTGASSTQAAIALTTRARDLGAAGALVVVPPYVKPTQAGIAAHFAALAEAVPAFPICAYNVPSRTGVNLQAATVQQLWRIPSIVALKESSGDLAQIGTIARDLPRGKLLLAGDDALALAAIGLGAHGLVSVAANVTPQAMVHLVAAAAQRAQARATAQHEALEPLFAALSAEPNPIPLKAALQLVGAATDVVRLPLLPAAAATRERLREALSQLMQIEQGANP